MPVSLFWFKYWARNNSNPLIWQIAAKTTRWHFFYLVESMPQTQVRRLQISWRYLSFSCMRESISTFGSLTCNRILQWWHGSLHSVLLDSVAIMCVDPDGCARNAMPSSQITQYVYMCEHLLAYANVFCDLNGQSRSYPSRCSIFEFAKWIDSRAKMGTQSSSFGTDFLLLGLLGEFHPSLGLPLHWRYTLLNA